MRLAYVVLLNLGLTIGIEQATQGRAIAARALGLENIDFIIINPEKNGESKGVRYVKLKERSRTTGAFDSIFRRYRQIETSIDLAQYDCIILRYPFADRSGVAFAKKHIVVTEHHTSEVEEISVGLANAPSLPRRISKMVRLALEKYYGPRTLKHSRAILAVTDEIRNGELARIGREIPSVVVANGINVSAINFTGFRPFDGRNLNLAMIASSFRPWHGLDRVTTALEQYRGTVSINLHLVGDVDPESINLPTTSYVRVHTYGNKTGHGLDEIMGEMNLAMGSMALYRNGLREACTLKTREYTARGLPFALAYHDPDLAHVETASQFYLQLANDNSLIDVQAIIDFAERMGAQRDRTSNYMRLYADRWMDWRVKVPRYIEVAQLIMAGQSR